ncbi:MAG: TatD family hydrolase [Candidatus Schekmanbacteria bacterium]|nr:TatD family hydrolase [Candidatus Schekmanbacteria bacterium]
MSQNRPGLVDAHCHLSDLDDIDAVVSAVRTAGIDRIVAISMDLPSMRRVLELHRQFPDLVLAGLGHHPAIAVTATDDERRACRTFAREHAAEADLIGEVGLDYFHARTEASQGQQRAELEAYLSVAADARLPVNLHSRRATRATVEVAIDFTRQTGLGALLHWFTHSAKLARQCAAAGVYISVGPSLISGAEQRKVCASIERALLLLETDSPQPFAGEPATPLWLPRVAAAVAEIWGCELEEVAETTRVNFGRYLRQGVPATRRERA